MSTESTERMYHLYVEGKTTGKVYMTNGTPLTHKECIIMRSKFSNPARIRLEEVIPTTTAEQPVYNRNKSLSDNVYYG